MQLYNKLLETALLPLSDNLLGTPFYKKLNEWRKLQWSSKEDLSRLQSEKLEKLLKYSLNNVRFYKEIPVEETESAVTLLKQFPIMDKGMIKQHLNDLLTTNPRKLVNESSSGSSGVQGTVYMTKEEEANNRAIQVLWWEWAGYHLGDNIIQTGMTKKRGFVKKMKDTILNTSYFIAFDLNEERILELLYLQRRNPKKMLLGYASSLFLIAKVAYERGINDIRFESVVSWGDKMFAHYRKLIESQFNTLVFDTYACTEGFMIAAQCKNFNYHIMTPQVYLEILDENFEEVALGEMGHVVVTRLDNYSMPLIRYSLGDLAVKADPNQTCECGRNLPILSKVIGRDTDIVKTASGKFLIVHFFTGIFEHFPEIKQFRVIQKDLNKIEIEYIKGITFFINVLEKIRDIIHENLGEKFPVIFKEVNFIPATSSGKPQIILSYLRQ